MPCVGVSLSYARMNVYRTTILEMHTAPGGLCTSWKRHGYTFDGSIHNLGGSSPASVAAGREPAV